jgi:hypothetical protein
MKKTTSACSPLLQANLIKKILFTFIATIAMLNSFAANITSTTTGGNWSSTSTWVGGVVPGAGDNVTINGPVTVDVAAASTNITINPSQTLSVNGGNTLTMSGNLVNNGTFSVACCGGVTTVTMTGSGTSISGSGTSTFYNLVINPGTSNKISLTSSNITLLNGGNMTLQTGIFKVGAANTITMTNGGNTQITAVNGNFANSTDGLGDTDADGGTIDMAGSSGDNLKLNSPTGTILMINNIITDPGNDGNWRLNVINSNSVRINGTLSVTGTGGNQWATIGNAPIWGASSSLYINHGGIAYTQGLEWSASSGTIGVTPGYPNNVTLVNMGNSVNGGSFPNVGWAPTGAVGLNGTLHIGDGTTSGLVSLHKVTSFSSGGIIVDNGSSLTSPLAGVPFIDNGNFELLGATTGNYNNHPGVKITFSGSGTIGSPQIISTTGSSLTFDSLTVSNGTYVKLNSPLNINQTLTLSSGYIGTSTADPLSVNNATLSAIKGGSATAYIDGPLSWALPVNSSGATSYVFPVGDMADGNAYLPMTLTPTNASASTVTVQAFNKNSNGRPDLTITTLSPTEYWEVSSSTPLSGGALVSVTRPSGVSPYNSLGSSATSNGIYTSIGGSVSGSSVINGGIGSSSPTFVVLVTAPLQAVRVGGTNASVDASCNPTTGSIIIGGVGGTPPYQFSMTSGSTGFVAGSPTATFSGLAAGAYSVWIKDATSTVTMTTLQVLGSLVINGNNKPVDICTGQSTTLTASNLLNPFPTYSWSWPPSNTATGASIVVSPTVPTTYTVTSTAIIPGSNLIVNGGFESGGLPTGMSGGYTAPPSSPYGSTPGNGGYFLVSTLGTNLCTNFTSLGAEEGNKFYIADGNINSTVVFNLAISGLTNGGTYQYSFYYASGSNDPNKAILSTTMSGGTITSGSGNVTTSNTGSWSLATYVFTATSTSVTMTMTNLLSTGSTNGNDFYLDNFQLIQQNTCPLTQTINVTLNCTLPVELIGFDAVKQGEGALVTWETANEQNSSYFVVEKSTDGVNFEPIGKLTAAGNSITTHSYSFIDPSIASGITYYRLAQYDINGEVHYSVIKTVSKEGISTIQVVPNPNNGTFAIIFDNAGEVESQISVFNALGQIVYEDSESTTNYKNIDISQLASGIYYLHVNTQAQNVVKKIIKE